MPSGIRVQPRGRGAVDDRCTRRIAPILIEGASFPAMSDLPDELAPLLKFQAPVLNNANWDVVVAKLIQQLERAEVNTTKTSVAPAKPGQKSASRRWPKYWYSTSAFMIEGIIACFVGEVGAFERNGQWITSGADRGRRDFLLSFILAKGRIASQ